MSLKAISKDFIYSVLVPILFLLACLTSRPLDVLFSCKYVDPEKCNFMQFRIQFNSLGVISSLKS